MTQGTWFENVRFGGRKPGARSCRTIGALGPIRTRAERFGPLGREILRDLEREYRAHGADMIAKLRKNEPRNYLKLLLLPVAKRPSAETGQDWLEGLSDEDLEAILKFARAELAKCADPDGQI